MLLRACYAMSGTDLAYAAPRMTVQDRVLGLTLNGQETVPVGLRPPYAMAGTDLAYGATTRRVGQYGTRAANHGTKCYLPADMLCDVRYGPNLSLSPYHQLSYLGNAPSGVSDTATCLRVCDMMSGTDLASGATCLRACYAMPVPASLWWYAFATPCPVPAWACDVRYCYALAMMLRACYAMSGTELAYAATACTSRMARSQLGNRQNPLSA
eukprot:3611831-Rhodomonas_salina.5